MDERYITPEVIEILSTLKEVLENKILKKQFFVDFLWKVNTDRLNNLKTVEKLHRAISWFYFNNFNWAIELVPLHEIVWYILDNFEPESPLNCCLLHSWELQTSFDEKNIASIKEQYREKGEEICILMKFVIKELCRKGRYREIV